MIPTQPFSARGRTVVFSVLKSLIEYVYILFNLLSKVSFWNRGQRWRSSCVVLTIFEISDLKNMSKHDLEDRISSPTVYNNFFVLNVVTGFKISTAHVNPVK